ncbi:MAG: hypothetical protein R3F62_24290 [Planctomycetota bacterium]
MRDPERIPEILALVQQVWERHPDERLGQLLLNACRGCSGWPDVWSVEDDALVAGLRARLPGAWRLLRAGEDGNPFLIRTFASREAAQSELEAFQARGHKQHYWLERGEG